MAFFFKKRRRRDLPILCEQDGGIFFEWEILEEW